MSVEARLAELNLVLPPPPKAMGVYKSVVTVGNLVYTSGHGPLRPDGALMCGKVGGDVDQQFGYDAAKQTGLAILASLKAEFGSLDKIKRVVKLLGMVNCVDSFTAQPAVINGCSELFRDVWGADLGVGARSAVGLNALPGNIAVEVEAIFELA